ncbi:MAG TPA: DEAD/DEAH box helicase [Polyangiaceae bacterium]|nr:DEAD/DEAH box helicase [Polyangiaceae bacterium]
MQNTNPVAGSASSDVAASAAISVATVSGVAFTDLGLSDAVLKALSAEGYVNPTPIQQKAIPEVLRGRDLLGCAQTGTGKTAAFALPMIERLMASNTPRDARRPRALVLSPTRELSAQIADSFATYGRGTPLKYAVIFGGVGQGPQISLLSRGLDVLVATPGRLLDLMNQGAAFLDKVEILVLDEADRMLDMGFLPDVKRILQKLPKQRQTLFFSATMPGDIERLSREILVDPVRVDVAPVSSTAERIEQSVYMVETSEKRRVLEKVLRDPAMERAIVFTRTKHGANRLVKELERGEIVAEAIHGNKSQGARQRALDNFRSGRLKVLIATDIAARGIDVDGISHVVNYDLPNIPESYVHRIGRTARAGKDGIAISLCSREERGYLRDIERLTRTPIRKLETPEPSAEDLRPRPARPELDARPAQADRPRFQGNRGPRPDNRGPRPDNRGPRPDNRGPRPDQGAQLRMDNRGPRPEFQAPAFAAPGQDRGGSPRRFDDRAAPREAQSAPSRFDGDRGPSQRRFDGDRNQPRRFDGPARPFQGGGGQGRPQGAPSGGQGPRDNRGPSRPQSPPQPEMYIRRPR